MQQLPQQATAMARAACWGGHLQQPRELAVAVGDVLARRALCERVDDIAQLQQAPVDGHALRKALACAHKRRGRGHRW